MVDAQSPMPWGYWISSIQICPGEQRGEATLLGSHVGGYRGPSDESEWWPQIVGRQIENLGNILLVDALPARIDLNVYLVAYGTGAASLDVRIVAASDAEVPLVAYEEPVMFVPPAGGDLPGVIALHTRLPACQVKAAGLYWAIAAINRGAATRIPLWVNTRAFWRANVEAPVLEQLRRRGMINPE